MRITGVLAIALAKTLLVTAAATDGSMTTVTEQTTYVESSEVVEYETSFMETVKRLSEEGVESVAAFNRRGEKLFESSNSLTNHVVFTESQYQFFRENQGVVILHNHPNGVPFSPKDVRIAAKCQIPIMVVVTTKYVYTLSARTSWPEEEVLYEECTAISQKHDDAARTASQTLPIMGSSEQDYLEMLGRYAPESFEYFWYQEVYKARSTEQKDLINIGSYSRHQAMLELADEFDLDYARIPLDEVSTELIFG